MKSAKSVSFEQETLEIIEQYQKNNGIWIFSKAVNKLIQQTKKEPKKIEQ